MTVIEATRPPQALSPSVTVNETETEYLVVLDVSDFTREELTVELDGDEVTVVGEQRVSAEDAEVPFRLHERLEESFRLPEDADSEWVAALYEHGMLELRAPKLGSRLSGRRAIEIKQKNHVLLDPEATPC
jgi:HSP20 family protein